MSGGNPPVDVAILGAGIVGLYLAQALLARGKRVALVDRGPMDIRDMRKPEPAVICPQRQHAGLSSARNHVFGGNAHFWGGGLIRGDEADITQCVGASADPQFPADSLGDCYQSVERSFGMSRAGVRRAFELPDPGSVQAHESEIFVLPGRRRNLSLTFRDSPELAVYPRSRVASVHRSGDGRITGVDLEDAGGKPTRLLADRFVIAMGVVDSNLFALEFAEELGLQGKAVLGTRLHDHLSTPLFTISPSGGRSRFLEHFAPRFESGFIVGKRLEIRQGHRAGWNPGALLHFQFLFDDVAPYRDIKRVLDLRQRGSAARFRDYAGALSGAARHVIPLARLALDRVLFKRLHIAERVPIVAVLDFESFPAPENRFQFEKSRANPRDALFHWDIRHEDAESFRTLFGLSEGILGGLARRYGIKVQAIGELQSARSLDHYLESRATDTYHLGGGLQASPFEKDGIVRSRDFSVHGIPNMHVISTATFRRPGLVNPTHTLLAFAERYARHV